MQMFTYGMKDTMSECCLKPAWIVPVLKLPRVSIKFRQYASHVCFLKFGFPIFYNGRCGGSESYMDTVILEML